MDELEISDVLGDIMGGKEPGLAPNVLYISGDKKRPTEVIITYNEELESDIDQLNEVELLLFHLKLALGQDKWQKLTELVFNEVIFKKQIKAKIENARTFEGADSVPVEKKKDKEKRKKNEDQSSE